MSKKVGRRQQKMRKTTAFYFLWGFWAENLCTLAKIVEAVISKLCSTFPEKSFGGKCFQKFLLSYFYAVFEQKDFVLWVKTFCMFLQTACYVYRSISVVFCFLLWIKKLSEFDQICLVWLLKASFYQSRTLVEDKNFEKN